MTPERKAVERWLAQWGIHNDAEIAGLLDAMEPSEGVRLERQRIYMALVDRLWGCDADANAVLDIVENESEIYQ